MFARLVILLNGLYSAVSADAALDVEAIAPVEAQASATCMMQTTQPSKAVSAGKSFVQVHAHMPTKKKLRVAVAVVAPIGLINSTRGWRDAFAVMSHSVQAAASKSAHEYELLAIMPNEIPNEDAEREAFQKVGIKLMSVPIPVPLDQVQNPAGAEVLKGALGQNEQLKYYGAALVDYDRAVVLDADVIFLQPIDELLEQTVEPYAAAGVYDHEMDIPDSVFPPVNSGFLVVKPSKADFDRLVGIYRKGDITGSGWEGSGTGWTYGTGSQGILSYFYNQVMPGKDGFSTDAPTKGPDYPGMKWTTQPKTSRFLPQDRSVYNVVDTKLLQQALKAGDTSADRVKVFHFAGGSCPKPWTCTHIPGNSFCDAMTAHWWQFRADFAKSHGVDSVDMHCEGMEYTPLPI